MADYNIKAEITADASGFESGVNKAQKASKNLSSTVSNVVKGLGKNGLVGALGAVGLASSGLSATLGTVVKVARKVSQAMGECTEAYKQQLIAERSLDTAIQNNPFVTGASANALKQFASEMQKVSNYGDEELIPMMANLVSLGRTEAETMQIMSVAMDMSAGMGISLDAAITQLNATLNGNIGRLGQQNAELKDLTAEELKQGKAIEILGEKFKGLSSATADTSKQLKNIKGDFKEALGQFTLPSSDMWNKFWAGFYERGIEVIGKINAYIDAQTIGKKLAGAITDQLKSFGTGDIGGRMDYIRNALKVVTDDELIALQNYLQGLNKISDNQKQVLNRIQAELDARKQITINQKAQADASAKQKREEDERLAKEKELAEIKEKQAKVLEEWEKKLFAIRLENLEEIRDAELENEELTQEEKLNIVEFYGEQILAMKLQQIEKEREEALNGENVSEEARAKINLYYEDKITQIKKEETKKREKYNKEETEEEKLSFKELVEMAVKASKEIGKAFENVGKKIASTIKTVISKVGNVFKRLFEFNPSEALDNLLVFEDSVLTFFVETLPNLPNFLESAFQSVAVLLQTVARVIDFDAIGKVIKTIVSGIADWVASGGWKDFLELVLAIQMALEKAVEENIDLFVDTIKKMLPDLVSTLIKSIVSASRTLGKIARVLLPLVAKIISAIVDTITSDAVVQASIEAVEGLIEGLIPAIVEIIVNALPKIISFVLIKLPSYTPQIVVGVISGLIKGFSNVNWGEVVAEMFAGFFEALANVFGIHFSDAFKSGFQGVLGILSEVLNKINECVQAMNPLSALSGGGSAGEKALDVGLGVLTGGAWNVGKKIGQWFGWWANGTNNVPKGLSIVGEAGPELIDFRGGERILNNRNTNKALAEMGGKTNNFNVTFNNLQDTTAFAMMNQLKAYNRSMAINGII